MVNALVNYSGLFTWSVIRHIFQQVVYCKLFETASGVCHFPLVLGHFKRGHPTHTDKDVTA